MNFCLTVEHLSVSREGVSLLCDVSLELKKGELCVLMGPNGAGKSTLANVLMGHPTYTVDQGRIVLDGQEITRTTPTERSKRGLFLSPQYSPEIAGVRFGSFLRTMINAHRETAMEVEEFYAAVQPLMQDLDLELSFTQRNLLEGFSGGERKRAEWLQMELLRPLYVMLDEPDSGLDIDATKQLMQNILRLHREQQMGWLIITHQPSLSETLPIDRVFILEGGKIARSGGSQLVSEVRQFGFKT